MEEKNRKRLEEALANLPQHEPDPAQWARLEAFLDFDDQLKSTLPGLPEHEPSDLLWNRIEEGLAPVADQKPVRVIPLFQRIMAVAASVLLLLAGGYLFWPRQQERVQVAYSVEEVYQESVGIAIADSRAQDEGISFIKEQCSQQPDICQRPDFIELQNQLSQLEADNQKLKQDLQLYGEDPMLVQSQIKIENLRAEITKEMIQLIIS